MASPQRLSIGRYDACPPLPLLPHELGLSDSELDLLCDIALSDLKLETRDAKVARDIRQRENFDTIAQRAQSKRR